MDCAETIKGEMKGRLDGRVLLGQLLLGMLILLAVPTPGNAAAPGRAAERETAGAEFRCGGKVEAKAWEAWEERVRKYVSASLIQERLLEDGDTYALYDAQMYLHNAVALARRCHRRDRLLEFSEIIGIAYSALQEGSSAGSDRRWICRGGSICNFTNGLKNKEVMLVSVQFLGLATTLANAIRETANGPLTAKERQFISTTSSVALEHLLRWASDEEIKSNQRKANAKAEDVTGGSSSLFFTDRSLWMIAIYAELSGLLAATSYPKPSLPAAGFARLHKHLQSLLSLFTARVAYRSIRYPESKGSIEVAEVDRGYWRNYADNRYAGYSGAGKPVVCKAPTNTEGAASLQVMMPPQPLATTGWDFSHARRLVYAVDALERNQDAMATVFPRTDIVPVRRLAVALANNLVAVVWNGDIEKPLFANYWSGANGWYRVAYNNGTGQCREGSAPYTLSDAFITGGYITWEKYNERLGEIGRSLYRLLLHPTERDTDFIDKYYPYIGAGQSDTGRLLTIFMFLPTLVAGAGS